MSQINQNLNNCISVLNHGFVELVDLMGDDSTPAQDARISYGNNKKICSIVEDEQLIRYLLRNEHMSPFEMIETKWRLKMPIFVARQHIRHRTASINEMSLRYTSPKDEFFIPSYLKKQAITNKQGSDFNPFLEDDVNKNILEQITLQEESAFNLYHELRLEYDVSRELARTVLPVSTYTEMIWKIDLRNMFNYLHLRLSSHAQYEIRVYAQAMHDLLRPYFPLCMKAFHDYILEEVRFSKNEFSLLSDIYNHLDFAETELINKTTICERYQLSGREYDDFMNKYYYLQHKRPKVIVGT